MNIRTLMVLVFAFAGSLCLAAPVDLNSADLSTLQQIKGIGPVKAQAIVNYRTQNGPFKSVEDLAKIKGIGAGKTLEGLRPLFTVGSTGTATPTTPPKR